MAAYMQYHQGNFYDMRNLPYGNFSYGYGYSMPAKVLNRRFKKSSIQLNDKNIITISVQPGKSKLNQSWQLNFSTKSSELTDTVCIPEPVVSQLSQQLRKLLKWRPSGSGSLPSSQPLILDDAVYRTQIVAEGNPDEKTYLIEIVSETRAKVPAERREIGSAFIPLGANGLSNDIVAKLKNVLAEALAIDTPLYHTRSHQGCDGSKFYLDLIRNDNRRNENSHYLKISQVTRDFRSIIHVPADDLEAFHELIDSSLKAMKEQQQKQKNSKKKRRQPKRRQRKSDSDEKENETVSSKEQPGPESDSNSANAKANEADLVEESKESGKEKEVNEQGDQAVDKSEPASDREKSENNVKDSISQSEEPKENADE